MTQEEIFQMKKIWRGSEIPVADYLMSFQEALRNEFMEGCSSVEEACLKYATDAFTAPGINELVAIWVNNPSLLV